jgi:hypothetical protein
MKEKIKKFFRLAAYYLFSMLFFASCVTEKQRQKICRNCSVKDSTVYKETIKIKDTTIFITQKSEPIFLENICDSLGILNFKNKVFKSNGLKTTFKKVGSSLMISCEADSLKKIIQLKELQINNLSKSTKIIEIPCKDERTSLDGFYKWFSIIVICIILIYLIFKFIKSYFKFI